MGLIGLQDRLFAEVGGRAIVDPVRVRKIIMTRAERPESRGAHHERFDDYGAVRSLLERIAAALDVPVEDKGALPSPGLSIMEQDFATRHHQRLVRYAKMMIDSRRARAAILPVEILGEPGYDLLVNGYIAWSKQLPMTLSQACEAAGSSQAIVLRWIALLVDQGLLQRIDDHTVGERGFVCLTDDGVELVTRSIEAQQAYLPAPR